jgi:hypothetical protein
MDSRGSQFRHRKHEASFWRELQDACFINSVDTATNVKLVGCKFFYLAFTLIGNNVARSRFAFALPKGVNASTLGNLAVVTACFWSCQIGVALNSSFDEITSSSSGFNRASLAACSKFNHTFHSAPSRRTSTGNCWPMVRLDLRV